MKEKARIQDDLYDNINHEWVEKAEIPGDKPVTGSFYVINDNVEEKMMADFRKFADGKLTSDVPAMEDAIRLYRKASDEKAREKEGIRPLLPLLEKIRNLSGIDALNALSGELLLSDVSLPFEAMVSEDFKDSSKHCFAVMDPQTILPDKTYYEKTTTKRMMLFFYARMVKKLLKLTPLDRKEQKQYLADAVAFDDLIRKQVKSHEELADYVKLYNPMDLDELNKKLQPFDLKGLLHQLYGDRLPKDAVIGTGNPRYVEHFKEIFNEKTFPLYQHWAYVNTIIRYAPRLSFEIETLAGYYSRKMMGIKKPTPFEKSVYRMVSEVYSEPLGVYYGRTYFGEEAKKDIAGIVNRIIETYKSRVGRNTFLAEETKQKAIKKLSAIKIKVGYPDDVNPLCLSMKVDEKDSYYDAFSKVLRTKREDSFSRLLKKTDPNEWAMPGHMVNACYDPFRNDITFPAAILQKPFYDLHQSVSENLGGIGAVIGHEISHAFDNNGSHFDEHGNLNDWWKEEDFREFEKLTQLMVEQFDGIMFHGSKVNGKLIVSENIADNGGMAVTLDIMRNTPDADFQLYFKNWARVWCMKAKENFIKLLLANDVHAPDVLRANMPPRNFKEWYDAFDVKESDGMFIPEEKRINIW